MTCVTLDIRQAGSPLHQCRGAPEKADREGSIIIIVIINIVVITGVVSSIVSTVFLVMLFSPGQSVHLKHQSPTRSGLCWIDLVSSVEYLLKITLLQTGFSLEFQTRFSLEKIRRLYMGTFSKLDPVWNSKLDSV